ncbi:beta-propeller domain-containing protein [bacterium]|nr:beta-propeller domain-containing protein [bacterium]
MTKLLKMFVILAVFSFVFVACSNSRNFIEGEKDGESGESDEDTVGETGESEFNGNEKFITVGEYDEYRYDDDEYCPDHYYRSFPKSASAAALNDNKEEHGVAERYIAESKNYKINGSILWLLHKHKGLISVDISNPENMKVLDSVIDDGYWYSGEMYFKDGRAYVLVSNRYKNNVKPGIHSYSTRFSELFVIDTTNPADLSVLGAFEIDGQVTDSRLNGDFIYAVVSESAEHFYYCNGEDETSGTDQISIVSLNVEDPQNIKMADKVSITGSDDIVYFSQNSVYVAENDKKLAMFDISSLEGKIVEKTVFGTTGLISDSQKMHENNGTLFVVTSTSEWGGESIIESFDVSNPANVRHLGELIFNEEKLVSVKFEGNKIYAVTNYPSQLYVIDISDPRNIKKQETIVLQESADYLEIHGTKLFAVMQYSDYSAISLYSIVNPDKPKMINTIKISEDSDMDGEKNNIKIFDEPGIILIPFNFSGEFHWPVPSYKLYIVDFDTNQGLKTRGFIESDTEIEKAIAIQDFIFSINETRIVTIDAKERDNLNILSEFTFAKDISDIRKCGKSLCNFNNLRLVVYDNENFDKLWESTRPSGNDYGASMVSNSNYGYIFITKYSGIDFVDNDPDFDEQEISKESRRTIKTVKFSDDGIFEETEEIPFKIKASLGFTIVLENNIIAINGTKYIEKNDGSGCYKKESKIFLLDMNDTEKGIQETELDFNYKTIGFRDYSFVSGTTLWRGGCKLKQKDPENEELAQFYCYAFPFDVSDPKNPKAGEKINIPGELAGVSDDGKYLYSRTPTITEYGDCPAEDGFYCRTDSRFYDFYILKLNEDKTDVEIIKKEPLGYFSNRMKSMEEEINYHDTSFSRTDTVSYETYIKNNKVFFVKNTEWEEEGENLTGCYEYDSSYEVKLVSAEGEELYLESFETPLGRLNSVKDGGFLVSTEEGLKYIDENGESKVISDNLNFSDMYFYNSQLLNGKIYIPVGWDGIYAVDVK